MANIEREQAPVWKVWKWDRSRWTWAGALLIGSALILAAL